MDFSSNILPIECVERTSFHSSFFSRLILKWFGLYTLQFFFLPRSIQYKLLLFYHLIEDIFLSIGNWGGGLAVGPSRRLTNIWSVNGLANCWLVLDLSIADWSIGIHNWLRSITSDNIFLLFKIVYCPCVWIYGIFIKYKLSLMFYSSIFIFSLLIKVVMLDL